MTMMMVSTVTGSGSIGGEEGEGEGQSMSNASMQHIKDHAISSGNRMKLSDRIELCQLHQLGSASIADPLPSTRIEQRWQHRRSFIHSALLLPLLLLLLQLLFLPCIMHDALVSGAAVSGGSGSALLFSCHRADVLGLFLSPKTVDAIRHELTIELWLRIGDRRQTAHGLIIGSELDKSQNYQADNGFGLMLTRNRVEVSRAGPYACDAADLSCVVPVHAGEM